jgi:hypothetical protein
MAKTDLLQNSAIRTVFWKFGFASIFIVRRGR